MKTGFFAKTKEEMRAWLEKHADDNEPGGLMACSPEIYAEMMAANERAFKEHVDSANKPAGRKPDQSSNGGVEGA